VGEIRLRIDLYEKCFEFCRTGRFSLARFLALVPDRLRLVARDRRLRIPVVVDGELTELWRNGFTGLSPAASRPKDVQELRRVLRLAQLDPNLDPLLVLAWLRERGDRLVSSASRIYQRGLLEIGRGEGGEETAYLIHLLAAENMRRSAPEPHRMLAFVAMRFAQEALLESETIESTAISARLGLLYQATLSPFALGVEPDRLARTHLNAYRTNIHAVELARRVIQEPIEMIPLNRAIATIAKRLAVDPDVEPVMAREQRLELMRDAAMLALLESKPPFPLLEEVCRSEQALLLHLSNERRRKLLLEAVASRAAESPKASAALQRFLAPETDLSLYGTPGERAEIAAAGAIALVLDEQVERAKRNVTALIQEVPESEWEAGRAYRISCDEAPLHQLARDRQQAMLYVRIAHPAVQEAIEEVAHRFEVTESRRVEEAAAFRGDVVTLVELARAIEHAVAEGEAERPAMLGGISHRKHEVQQEIGALDERLATVDAAMRRSAGDNEALALLIDGKSLIERQLTLLHEIASELSPEPVRAAMLIAEGDASEEEAQRAVISVGWIESERNRALEAARRARPVERPFFAAIRRRARLDLPDALIRDLDAARLTPAHVAVVASRMAQWLRGEIDKRIASPALLTAWTDPPYEIHNGGAILLSGAALASWQREKQALWFEDRTIEPDEPIASRWSLERAPERFRLARRRGERTAVAIFRYVGEAALRAGDAIDLWELVRIDAPFASELIALESPGDTRRE
jgi:hypothetical protein